MDTNIREDVLFMRICIAAKKRERVRRRVPNRGGIVAQALEERV